MPNDQFGLFVEDAVGPMFRQFSPTLQAARIKAHEIADRERFFVLIFGFVEGKQVDRISPAAKPLP